MESRATRKALRAFPPDLAFTQDPKDDLRILLDVQGRQTVMASEYMRSQLENVYLSTADVNEPYYHYVSGMVISLDAAVSGNLVSDLQDLTTMQVTGFDYVEDIYPSGIDFPLYGISYADEPDASGVVYLSATGTRTIFKYNWKDFQKVVEEFTASVETQSFEDTDTDEYLTITEDATLGKIATLKHVPIPGSITIIDTKNLQAPWAPDISDGIEADMSEVTLSGSTLMLTSPRPSYNPATTTNGVVSYPVDYQPDEEWKSAFLVEYQYYTKDAPQGLTQKLLRHELGQPGRPLVAADNVEEG